MSSMAASWVRWVPGLAARDAASMWGRSLGLGTEVQHLVRSQGLASANFPHHCEWESHQMEARGLSVAPHCPWAWSPPGPPCASTHLPDCSPGFPQSGPLTPCRPLPGPQEALALASFRAFKPEMRPPPGTVLCTPLRPTHELFLEHVGSVLSSLAGLPGCCAAARTLPPAAGAVSGLHRPAGPLVQTVLSPVCDSCVCKAGGGVLPAAQPCFRVGFVSWVKCLK